jgi:hypothetical protein
VTAPRPCDRASATVLAFEAEMTALGLLPDGNGKGGTRSIATGLTGPGEACGSDYGYRQHLRAGEDACPGCKAAHAVAGQKYRKPERPACPCCRAPKPDHLITCATVTAARRAS